MEPDRLSEVANLLAGADRVLFITGAGISADSGLPTYRGIGGLYDNKETAEGMPIEVVVSGGFFQAHPEITWKYLWEIGSVCRGAEPNRAHEVIANIEREKPESWVMTQNVDGFHRAAGSKNLVEVHGNASRLYCCDCRAEYSSEGFLKGYSGEPQLPPRCPKCNGVIRPDVVLFGELLPAQVLQFFNDLPTKKFDLVFSIGTTGLFQYISEPVYEAKRRGVPTVEINPAVTDLSRVVDYSLRLGAAEAMDKIWQAMKNPPGGGTPFAPG